MFSTARATRCSSSRKNVRARPRHSLPGLPAWAERPCEEESRGGSPGSLGDVREKSVVSAFPSFAYRCAIRESASPATSLLNRAVVAGDRTSSTKWWTNQYRMLLAALAYTLLETMRRTALRGTDLARAQCQTLRLRLLRIGAVVTRNTRTVVVRLSSSCPDQAVFRLLVHRLTAG